MSTAALLTESKIRTQATSRWTRLLTPGSVVLADLLALSAAGVIAVFVRYIFRAQYSPSDYLSFAPAIPLFLVVFAFTGLYPGIGCSPIEEFRLILKASSVGLLVLIGSTFFLREGQLSSRVVLALAWVLAGVFVPLSRRMMRGYCSLQTWWGVPTVVIGEEHAGVMMVDLLKGHARLGLKPVALLTDGSPHVTSTNLFRADISHARRLADVYPGCYAVIAMPTAGSDRLRAVLSEHLDTYGNVFIIPDLFGMRSLSVTARDMCGVLTLKLHQKLSCVAPRLLKRSFDAIVAFTALMLTAPIWLPICLLVKLSSKGPIFYSQSRIGQKGDPFRVWKFRTMVSNADEVLQSHLASDPALREEWIRDQKLKNDPRVTAIGNLLRRSSLDELPQLWNVLRGDMSLVGPRPIVSSEIEKYGDSFQQYQLVSPGLTGLWQISGRNNTTYDLRIRMDDYYVRNWSLPMDIYILLRTVKTILLSEGAY